MKVRYKITAAFTLLTVAVLAALCVMIYYITAGQQERDFDLRLHNRALTVASLLSRLPDNGYQILSKFDSATTNLLVQETIDVFDEYDRLLYHFAKKNTGKPVLDAGFLADIHAQGSLAKWEGTRRISGIFYNHSARPIVVVSSAIDENGMNNLSELARSLTIAFVTGIVFSFLIGWAFSKQLTRPVEKITTTVNAISANNIQERLPEPPVNDEWKKLAVTFNNLLQRLQDSFEIQGRFISNASHELSTPLTAVANQIDVVLRRPRTSEEYEAVIRSVQADIGHMSALTQQLLNLARTARGGSLQTAAVRVDEIIMELPSLLKKQSPDYGAQVFFDELPEDESLVTVNGNYELLLSAFRNIAENGCKYSPDHTVHISLSFADRNIIVLFSNSFDDFNPGEIETIFQPFQRGANAMHAPGHGLGLSLTRRIILLHKGEIKAEIINGARLLITLILPAGSAS